jgi:hypothetical protein
VCVCVCVCVCEFEGVSDPLSQNACDASNWTCAAAVVVNLVAVLVPVVLIDVHWQLDMCRCCCCCCSSCCCCSRSCCSHCCALQEAYWIDKVDRRYAWFKVHLLKHFCSSSVVASVALQCFPFPRRLSPCTHASVSSLATRCLTHCISYRVLLLAEGAATLPGQLLRHLPRHRASFCFRANSVFAFSLCLSLSVSLSLSLSQCFGSLSLSRSLSLSLSLSRSLSLSLSLSLSSLVLTCCRGSG